MENDFAVRWLIRCDEWVRSMPVWLWCFLAVFVVKGVFLVFVGLPFYGEDEISHFGYVEALARTDSWYSFSDNYSSIGSRVVRQLLVENPDLSEQVISKVQSGGYAYLREYASGIHNSTAYQPPLYYWSGAQFLQLFPNMSVVSWLYLMRFVSVGFGVLVVFSSYLLARLLFRKEIYRVLMVGVVTFTPLLGLLGSTVTVQIAVIGLYALLFALLVALLKYGWRSGVMVMAGAVLCLGLLMQQSFWAAPILMIIVGIMIWLRDKQLKWLLIWLGMILVLVFLTLPDYWQRMHEVQILVTPIMIDQPFLEWWYYPLKQGERVKTVLMTQFWDQHNSFLPYRASESLVRVMQSLVMVGGMGLVIQVWLGWQKLGRFYRETFVLSAVALIGFVGAHSGFDWLQLSHGGQEYLKVRYFYPLLLLIVGGLVVGWRYILERLTFPWLAQLGILTIMIWLHGSAVIWLLFLV